MTVSPVSREVGCPELTHALAGVLADFLEVFGGGVLVVTAVLGQVAGHLLGGLGADGLDVGRVGALAARVVSLRS